MDLELAELVLSSAEKIVMKDRAKYIPLFEVAEEFAYSRGMILGGDVGILTILGYDLNYNNFNYVFYTDNAIADSRAMIDAIFEKNVDLTADIPDTLKFLHLSTGEHGKEYTIIVDDRQIIKILAVEKHRGLSVSDIIPTVDMPAQFAKKDIKCIGSELQLIDIYTSLCNPSKVKEWEQLIYMERELRNKFLSEFKFKKHTASINTAGCDKLINAIKSEFITQKGRVLIGSGRLQVISEHSLKDEEGRILLIAKRLEFPVEFTYNDPKLLTNTRLRRLTVYCKKTQKVPILDIYNAGSYEVVPFVQSGELRVGTFFVNMRFALIDIWVIRLIGKMGAIEERYMDFIVNEKMVFYQTLSDRFNTMSVSGTNYDHILPIDPEKYIGKYEDLLLHTKREKFVKRQERKHFNLPYFPILKKEGAFELDDIDE